MNTTNRTVTPCVVVEEEVQFTLVELSRVCRTDVDQLVTLVMEGVLTPSGEAPERWRFGGATLRRARVALRLSRDLELNAASTALVLDLLDEIDALRSRLRCLGSD
ncbi:chaperone modulator CbpM [Allochromatium palmeri]|uniref:MerR family transcriptional regulator n=1 Tax=Allochromatium palmeri TaxID=231048 RepID=A0A6N8EHV3_9GAMM|nr:chaperone modulator CbpM [Allochromatium palmeri]MTW23191.1 MerR family transcriptional regulator [Allochromatium palmeri]